MNNNASNEKYTTCESSQCSCNCAQDCVRKRVLTEDESIDSAEIFAQLSSPARVRLLSMLVQGDMCVCHMAEMLEVSQPAVSHHLKSLRQCGIVRFKKQGKRAVYSLADSPAGEMIRRIMDDIHATLDNPDKEDDYANN